LSFVIECYIDCTTLLVSHYEC